MFRKLLILLSGIILIFIIFLFFTSNTRVDRWICDNNEWKKQGNPTIPKPIVSCNKKIILPKTEVECINSGGIWKKLGPDPVESCNRKALDRGNICYDSSECEGQCQANLTSAELDQGMKGKTFRKNGQCSVYVIELGCRGLVENGIIKVICMD